MYLQTSVVLLLTVHFVSTFPSKKCILKDNFKKCITESQNEDAMNRVFAKDKMATCNDGSRAGYYVRRNPLSSQWIIYLEGGWFCHDPMSCSIRMAQNSMLYVTSSKSLAQKRIGTGLLSSDKHENPEFWAANHVYIPYCSSDFWVGNTSHMSKQGAKISFRGSLIVSAVVNELLSTGLQDASSLILAGSSAGGIGVLQNIDRISAIVSSRAANKNIKVRGIVDSAWFLDSGSKGKCTLENCSPDSMFKAAVKYWKASVHPSCEKKYGSEKHKCLFAPNTMDFVNTPVLIFQWMMDTVQMMADNSELKTQASLIYSTSYENYMKQLTRKVRSSLKKISRKHGLFAPSCVAHTGLATIGSLNMIKLRGKRFNDVLKCWLTDKQTKTTKCRRRIVDNCSGMKCHNTCPTIYHPLTGKKIRKPHEPYLPPDNAKYYLELLTKIYSWENNNKGSLEES